MHAEPHFHTSCTSISFAKPFILKMEIKKEEAGEMTILKSAAGGGGGGEELPHPLRRHRLKIEIEINIDFFKMTPAARIHFL